MGKERIALMRTALEIIGGGHGGGLGCGIEGGGAWGCLESISARTSGLGEARPAD